MQKKGLQMSLDDVLNAGRPEKHNREDLAVADTDVHSAKCSLLSAQPAEKIRRFLFNPVVIDPYIVGIVTNPVAEIIGKGYWIDSFNRIFPSLTEPFLVFTWEGSVFYSRFLLIKYSYYYIPFKL